MFKIGEFSKLTQVSIRMLRYYDEQGLLKPAEVDEATGYRFYSADQIVQLRRIVFLRDLGCTVAEIGEALACWQPESVDALLDGKRLEAEEAIAREQEKLSSIELAKRDLRGDAFELNCNVSIKTVPGVQVLSLRRVVADYYQEGCLWKELGSFVQRTGIPPNENTFTIYHDIDYREEDVDMELCMPCSRVDGLECSGDFSFRCVEEVPFMASFMLEGPFELIAEAFRSFAAWLEQHNQYEMSGGSRQIVHRGPWNEKNPSRYVIELQIPLAKK